MSTFCHSTIAARIETAAAAIILFLTTLTSCGRNSSLEPLDQWNDGTSTLHTADPVIAEGRKLFNDKEYQKFPTHRRSPHTARLRSRPPLSYGR